MLRGTVKWFNNTKGYGFITYGDLEDIFVHYSAIRKDGYKTLKEGNVVDFKLKKLDDEKYVLQLHTYRDYIKQITNLPIKLYLISAITGEVKEIQ